MAGALTAAIAAAFAGGAAPPSTDDYFEYTTLLLPGNGTNGAQNNTFLDGSTNNFTITRNGNTTQGTFSPFSQTGWGNYFDGSGDYLTVNDNGSNSLDLGSGQFSIEFWWYPQSASGGQYPLIGDSTGNWYVIWDNNAGSNAISLGRRGQANDVNTTGFTLATNVWQQIVVTRQSTGTNDTRIFVDGVLRGIGTSSQNYVITTTLGIGGTSTGTNVLTGYLSGVRLVKGSVPSEYQTSVTTTGTQAFTLPTTPPTADANTQLLTCQYNRFRDASTNNFTITRNGDTRVVAFSPFNPSASWSAATYGGSGYFDGSGDYLQGPVNSAFAFGTGEYCMEGWIYMTSAPASPSGLIDLRRAAPNYNAPWLNVTSGYKLALRDGTVGSDVITGTTNIQLNTWTHVCVTRQTVSNAGTRIFLNGVLDANSVTNNSNYTNGALTLATAGDSLGSFMFTGYMSNVRITKGSVPTSYQTSATTSGTSVFTPPTAPATTTSQGASSPSLLLNFTNAGIYDATSKNDLETVGNAQISTTQSKWGGSSMAFDGTGDWLLIPDQPIQRIGTGNFTVEGWVYRNSSGTYGLIGKGTGTTGWLLSLNSSNQVVFTYGSSTITSTGTVSATTWTHIAVVREGTSTNQTKIYINGTNDGTGTVSTDFNQTNSMYVGADRTGGSAANAYMQDVRVTNYARYTTNFTAPTAAFPTL
jgi:hypothetical protein